MPSFVCNSHNAWGAKLHARHAGCIFACDDNQRRIGDIGCVGDDDHLSDYRQRCIERGCNNNWICHELDALRNLPSGTYTILAMDLPPSGPYLGAGCALGYSDMGQLTLLGYGVAAGCLSVLIYALVTCRVGGVLNGSSD